MTFNPNNITKDHVLNAIKQIKETNTSLINGNKWEVIIDGVGYPARASILLVPTKEKLFYFVNVYIPFLN